MSEKIECPHCKALNKVKREYCWICGKNLRENTTKDKEEEVTEEVIEEVENVENTETDTSEATESNSDINSNTDEVPIETTQKKNNIVAVVIKVLAIILAVLSVLVGLISIADTLPTGITIILTGLISSVFIYATGEIIQLLEDIKNK